MKPIRTRYPWPASAIGAADMRMLYEIRQASRPRVSIAGLVVRAIRETYAERDPPVPANVVTDVTDVTHVTDATASPQKEAA